MRVETVNGIVCAVNATVTMCSVRTCQHSYMTDDQHSEYKAAIQKEYNRKQSLASKKKERESKKDLSINVVGANLVEEVKWTDEYKAAIQKEYNRKQSLALKKKA